MKRVKATYPEELAVATCTCGGIEDENGAIGGKMA